MMCQRSEQVTECELAVSLTSEFEQLKKSIQYHEVCKWTTIYQNEM